MFVSFASRVDNCVLLPAIPEVSLSYGGPEDEEEDFDLDDEDWPEDEDDWDEFDYED